MTSEYMSVEQVAKAVKLPLHRIYYAIQHGQLKHEIVIGKMAISQVEVLAFKKRMAQMKVMPSVEDYCRSKGISRNKFNYMVQHGGVKVVKIGGRVFVPGKAGGI
jgi:hypothetical protein